MAAAISISRRFVYRFALNISCVIVGIDYSFASNPVDLPCKLTEIIVIILYRLSVTVNDLSNITLRVVCVIISRSSTVYRACVRAYKVLCLCAGRIVGITNILVKAAGGTACSYQSKEFIVLVIGSYRSAGKSCIFIFQRTVIIVLIVR